MFTYTHSLKYPFSFFLLFVFHLLLFFFSHFLFHMQFITKQLFLLQFQTCEGRCTEFRDCVQCKAFESGILEPDECDNCSIIPEIVDEIGGMLHFF